MRRIALIYVFLCAACGSPSNDGVGATVPDPARSTVTVDRSTGVIADGSDSIAITVTARNRDGAPLAGHIVLLTVTDETASTELVQPTAATDAHGSASGALRSTLSGAIQITATIDPAGSAPIDIAQPATVEFVAGPPALLAFGETPAAAGAGAALSAVTVTVEDAHGNVATDATTAVVVALADNPAGGVLAGTTTEAAVAGIATFADLVIDRAGSDYELVASAPELAPATSPSFAVADAPPDAALSSVLASPTSGLVADGSATATVTVEVVDDFGNALAGQAVLLSATGSGNTIAQPAPTDATGTTFGTIASTHAETKTLSVTVGGVPLVETATATFVAGPATTLALTAGSGGAGASGATTPIVVTATDANGNVSSGSVVAFAVTRGGGTVAPAQVSTDVAGDAQTMLTFGSGGTDTVTAQLAGVASSLITFTLVAVALEPATQISAGDIPSAVAMADLDGDGKRDLVVVNRAAGTVSVFINATAPGATTAAYAPRVDFATGAAPDAVAIADVNGDGKLDLAVANAGSSTVSVLLNATALGSAVPAFVAKTDFATASGPTSVTVGDLNGDGVPDLAVATASAVSVLFDTTAPGATAPSFATAVDFATGAASTAVALGDVNKDGMPDLVVTNSGASTISILVNQGVPGATLPSFAPRVDVPTGAGPASVAIADLNGDGLPDVATANKVANSVSVLFNTTAPGSTTPSYARADFPTGTAPTAICIGDLNGDGRRDLAVGNADSNTASVLLNVTAPGAAVASFAAKVDVATGAGPAGITCGDLNGDGKADILVADAGADDVSVIVNVTTFGRALDFAGAVSFPATNSPNSLAVGDFNSDGRLDVVVANGGSNTVSVFINTTEPGSPAPLFAIKHDFPTGMLPNFVAAGDLNGDGMPDLVITNQDPNTVSILLNTTIPGSATPSFATKVDFSTGTVPLSVAIRDLNGDGLADLVVSNQTSHTVSVLLNTTTPGALAPRFAPKVDFEVDAGTGDLTAGDLNGDGMPDIVVVNITARTVSILLNTTAAGAAAPSFADKVSLPTGSGAFSAALGDLNGDGKADIAFANQNADSVSVLFNQTAPGATAPSFGVRADFPTASTPFSVAIADLDGDGELDLAVANVASSSVSVLRNTTTISGAVPTFVSTAALATGDEPLAIVTADFNGDGEVDIVTANSGSDSISVILAR